MKRKNNLYEEMCTIDNLLLAYKAARKGKGKQSGVIRFDKNFDQNIADIYRELVTKTYRTSKYRTKVIKEKKERIISILPFRDRIVQHLAMIVLKKLFVSTFTADTYGSIKGKGTHALSRAVKKYLKDKKGTKYCLQLDVKKFYPSVDNPTIKMLIRKKIKDIYMLDFLDRVIDSASGIPIGNYLSQYFANFYLTYFDHWLKETKMVQYYARYVDDLVILHGDKVFLHSLLVEIREYLLINLKLTLKGNYKVFLICDNQGVDVVGYVHFHDYTLVRKINKKAFARKVAKNISNAAKASYLGLLKHCNSKNLINKLLPNAASK